MSEPNEPPRAKPAGQAADEEGASTGRAPGDSPAASDDARPQPRYGQYAPLPDGRPRYGEISPERRAQPDKPPAHPLDSPPPFPQGHVPTAPGAKPPTAIAVAAAVWLVSAVAFAVMWLWMYSSGQLRTLVDQAAAMYKDLPGFTDANQAALDSLLPQVEITVVVIYVAIAAVQAFMAIWMLRGRGWARIVLSVFGVIAIVLTFGSFTLASLAIVVIFGAGLVLMWTPPSSAYFRDVKARRIAAKR